MLKQLSHPAICAMLLRSYSKHFVQELLIVYSTLTEEWFLVLIKKSSLPPSLQGLIAVNLSLMTSAPKHASVRNNLIWDPKILARQM